MRRRLEQIEIPAEHAARERAWSVVSAAFSEREPTQRTRRKLVPVLLVALVAAVVAASLSPPGRALFQAIRESVGVEKAQPALFSLPAPGRLLVRSSGGIWVVQADGSKRRLGAYREASWSPHGRYVVATRANTLYALTPHGEERWSLSRPGARVPRWTGTNANTRIAYVDRSGVRVVAGDGADDRLLSRTETGPIAWRPGQEFALAYLSAGELRVQDADTRRILARAGADGPLEALDLAWSRDGRRALVVYPRKLLLVAPGRNAPRTIAFGGAGVSAAAFSPSGGRIAVLRRNDVLVLDPDHPAVRRRVFAGAGRLAGLAWSPDGRWLLVGLPDADQWVFVRVAGGQRIRAFANVSAQFRSPSLPEIEGWCCAG